MSFVPAHFAVPRTCSFDSFRLEALGPVHNERDHAAWTSSMGHIRATVGFENHSWPHPMTLDENLSDMVMHADEFDAGTSFTWSILSVDSDDVIGCIYLYPLDPPVAGRGRFRSWVSAAVADRDESVREALRAWFAADWPIDVIDWPG